MHPPRPPATGKSPPEGASLGSRRTEIANILEERNKPLLPFRSSRHKVMLAHGNRCPRGAFDGVNYLSDIVQLRGKTALITGGAKRIGAAVAEALADAGVNVALHYRNSAAQAEALAAKLRETGVKSGTFRADFAEACNAHQLWSEVHAQMGAVHFLINSASIFPKGAFAGLTRDDVYENLEVNALAPLFLSRMFAQQGGGEAIVNFLDTMAFDYDKGHVAYHLSKRTFHTLTQIMAVEFAPGIRVNAVAPGLILPPEGEDESYLDRLKKTNPLERFGSTQGIAEAVLFLLRGGFITGQTIFVDGGRHLRASVYG